MPTMSDARARLTALACAGALACSLTACPPSSSAPRSEGVDESRIPAELRADYSTFRVRCSKCHSLDRPLGTSIEDESYWREYVERMRRQPASGISPADGDAAVRFLLWYHRVYNKPAASAASAAGSSSP